MVVHFLGAWMLSNQINGKSKVRGKNAYFPYFPYFKIHVCICFLLHPKSLCKWPRKMMRFHPGKPLSQTIFSSNHSGHPVDVFNILNMVHCFYNFHFIGKYFNFSPILTFG